MAELPRLNPVIAALEAGKVAFTTFAPADTGTAIELAASKYDGVVFEMEHSPWDGRGLRDCLQYMLNRKQIAESGSIANKVAPMVRIPPNGVEKGNWHAKQALDMGCYGIIWPHISTVEEARNAVASCRYPRLKSAPRYEPAGIRGDAPATAARYWGLTQQEYYTRADVWPLDPKGEVLAVLQIEDTRGIEINHGFAERTTFIVSPDGKIVATLSGLAPEANVAKALEVVQKLADANVNEKW